MNVTMKDRVAIITGAQFQRRTSEDQLIFVGGEFRSARRRSAPGYCSLANHSATVAQQT